MLGIAGPARPVSTYDLFIAWHHRAMFTFTPSTQQDRNAAHSGPIFLPWHRFMLIQLELNLQRVLNDDTFGLPYWDWAAEGGKTLTQQIASPVWAVECMGGQGSPVASGPFTVANGWRVRLARIIHQLPRQRSRVQRWSSQHAAQTTEDTEDTESPLVPPFRVFRGSLRDVSVVTGPHE